MHKLSIDRALPTPLPSPPPSPPGRRRRGGPSPDAKTAVDSAYTPAAAKLESATTKARSQLAGPTTAKTAPTVAEARPAVRPAKPRAQVTKARGKEGAAKPTSKARERAQDRSTVKAALARQRARALERVTALAKVLLAGCCRQGCRWAQESYSPRRLA